MMKKFTFALAFSSVVSIASAQTINNLGSGPAVQATDLFPAYQGANPATKVSAAQIQTFLGLTPASSSFTEYVDGAAGNDSNTGFQAVQGITNAATSTSSPTLSFASAPGALAGESVFDSTTQRYVGAVQSTSSGNVTLTANAATAVASGDTIIFANAFKTVAKSISYANSFDYQLQFYPTIWIGNGTYNTEGQRLPQLKNLPVGQSAILHGDNTTPTSVNLTDSGGYWTLSSPFTNQLAWGIYGVNFSGTYGAFTGSGLTVPDSTKISISGAFTSRAPFQLSGFNSMYHAEVDITSTSLDGFVFNGGSLNWDNATIKFVNAVTLSGPVYSGDAIPSFVGANGSFNFVNGANVTMSGGANPLALTNGAYWESDGGGTVDGVALSRSNFPGSTGGGSNLLIDGNLSYFGPDNAITVTNSNCFAWASGSSGGALDTGFCRLAPGVAAFGNGTPGNFSGSLYAAGMFSAGQAGIGYPNTGGGVGGTVTQATSKSTGVTLNKISGQITMNNAALASGAKVSFTVTDSSVTAIDTVVVSVNGGTANAYRASTSVASGSFNVTLENISGGSLSESPVINFATLKVATN